MSTYLKLFENHSQYETIIGGGGDTPYVKPNVSHCIAENEVHYNPFVPDPYNGHAYVDLGLPSGTKWATMNVGANSETDYGLYFAWGDTQGYADASTKAFRWSDYKWSDNGSSSVMTKYNATDGKTVLDLEDDAAAVNWGGEWHMPTKEQCQELLNTDYVTNAWVTDYNGSGVNGRLFTNKTNGKTLFIPAGGHCDGGSAFVGYDGYVWASSLDSSFASRAWRIYFDSGGGGVNNNISRYYGYSVRGVVG